MEDVFEIINNIRERFGNTKKIWLYSGYTWENIFDEKQKDDIIAEKRKATVMNADVFVDGQFVQEKADLMLSFRGSSNQRVINVVDTLKQDEMVLWEV